MDRIHLVGESRIAGNQKHATRRRDRDCWHRGPFSGAENLDQFWANVRGGIDATGDVPPGRWLIDPERAFDPRVAVADHVYSLRGGFIAAASRRRERTRHRPGSLERLDPVFHLALHVARQAWDDARTEHVDRHKVGVIFGNIVLPTETASALSREIMEGALEESLGVPARPRDLTEPLNAFPAGLPAALVARALALGGPAYTIDAACGSSLYSLKLAVDELQSGRADAMLCGGVSRPDPLYTQMGFSQLRALSARGKPAPLDHRGDGLVVGEGAGMFVLKRLADALAHGDRIYGVVAGIGLSNDIHGDLLAPSSEGQLRAMRMAYDQAGWSPGDVDLVECHAAGTPLGDAVEVESLKSLWGESGWKTASVRDRLGQVQHRPHPHRGRCRRPAQGAPRIQERNAATDGKLRAARAQARPRREPVPRPDPRRGLAATRRRSVRGAPPSAASVLAGSTAMF